jgi:hypothetical protein
MVAASHVSVTVQENAENCGVPLTDTAITRAFTNEISILLHVTVDREEVVLVAISSEK